MTQNSKYEFEWGNGLVKFNSLSPNGDFYYQIKRPDDLYWGLFVARIAFHNHKGELIYYNKTKSADPICDKITNMIRYASYSKNGYLVYFRERKQVNQLRHILLDLCNRKYKAKDWSETDDCSLLELGGFSEDNLNLFVAVDWQMAIANRKYNRNIFCKHIWHPRLV